MNREAMEPEEYQLIDRYISNELNDAERTDFENRLKTDAEFASFVATYTSVNSTLQAKADRKEQEEELKRTLDEVSDSYFSEEKPSGKVVSMRNIYWAAAASILLVISFIFIINQNSAPSYNEYAHYDPLVLTSRGETTNLSTSAEEAFNNQQYARAAESLEQLVKSQPQNAQLKTYWALSLIETDQYKAGDSLLLTIEKGSSLYAQTATWYMALSLLKQGKIRGCKKQLEKINEGDYKFEEAQQLLDEL